MKNTLEFMKKHKLKFIAGLSITVVGIGGIMGYRIYNNHKTTQELMMREKQENQAFLDKEKAIALKLIANEKEIVKDNEEAIHLQNELQQAINNNDQEKITVLKQKYVAKVVAIKEEKAKVIAHKVEEQKQEKKEEEKKEEQQAETSNSNTTIAVNNGSSSTTHHSSTHNSTPTQSVKKEQPKSTQPTPTPKKEEPKKEEYYPNKYCTYNGNRQRVKNICMYGSPRGTGYVSNTFIKYVNNGMIDKIVWKDEPERYYLLDEFKDDIVIQTFKKSSTPNDSHCFVNGSCFGFNV